MSEALEARIKELEDRNEQTIKAGRDMLMRAANMFCEMENDWRELELQNSKLMDFIRRNHVRQGGDDA